MSQILDIGATTGFPLHPNYGIKTVYDGVFIHSFESFLLGLQIFNRKHQEYFCSSNPDQSYQDLAKMREKDGGYTGFVFWQGKHIHIDSQCFDVLIDRVLLHLMNDEHYRQALIDSRAHSLSLRPEATDRFTQILPAEEYVRRLIALRKITTSQHSTKKGLAPIC